MNWNWIFQLILWIGAIQGIVLGILLWGAKSKRNLANRFLAILLFFLAYRLVVVSLRTSLVVTVDDWAYQILLEYNWCFGALLFFYVYYYLQPNKKWNQGFYIHFLPVGIEFLFSNWVKVQNFFWDGRVESLPFLGAESYQLWMHTPFNIVVASLLIVYYCKKLYTTFGQLDHHHFPKWLKSIVLLYGMFAVLAIGFSIADYFFFNYAFGPFSHFPIYSSMAVLTYVLGLVGYSKRNEPIARKLGSNHAEEFAPIIKTLHQLMEEEELFKDPQLSLNSLAKALSIKPYVLSQVLNRGLSINFNDFINSFRVKEVQRLLAHSDYQHLTLTAIAFEAGFNSKASFNRAVKKLTGKSPKDLKVSNR